MSPKLVIFDCDGVLVDSEGLTHRIIHRAFARHGFHLSMRDTSALFLGGTLVGAMQEAQARGAVLPKTWLEDTYAEVFAGLGQTVEAIPGIVQVLDALDAAGMKTAVASNGPMRKMEITLKRTGLWDRLEGRIFSAHDCPAVKPAPDVYLKAAQNAGIAAQDCVVVEDSATGARAAVAAHMRCFGFASGTAPDVLAPHCVEVFDKMDQLPSLLGL